jgi:thiazole synthase
MKDYLLLNGNRFESRLLHCFGMPAYGIGIRDLDLAVELIRQSETNFITIYTHGDYKSYTTIEEFPLGYGGLKLKDIKSKVNTDEYTFLINTNDADSASDAVGKVNSASNVIDSRYIKLEVLNKEGTRPNNDEVLCASKELIKNNFIVMPIINADIQIAQELEAIGCACIRVLLSDIGSLGGLANPAIFSKLCESVSIPVIAEGGLSTPEEAHNAMVLGAEGVLVNKAIFEYKDPLQFIIALKNNILAGREAYLCKANRKQISKKA